MIERGALRRAPALRPLLALAVSLLCPTARAAPAAGDVVAELTGGTASSARGGAAARAFAEGTLLFQQRRYVRAIVQFTRAYELRRHFIVQCSIARCYENLGRMVQAATHYRRCLKNARGAALVTRIRAALRNVEAQISWITVRADAARGAGVYLNGRRIGAAPQRVAVAPGTHVVEVRRTGARAARAVVRTLGGERRVLTLIPVDHAPAVHAREVTQPPAATTHGPTGARRTAALRPAYFWIATGLTVALAAATAVVGAQTLGLRADYRAAPTERGYDRFVRRRMLTNLLAVGTGVAGGTSMLLFFYTDFSRSPDGRGGERITTAGLGVRGAF